MAAETELRSDRSDDDGRSTGTGGAMPPELGYPPLQEQREFNVARSIRDKQLTNTLNIRDRFFFSA